MNWLYSIRDPASTKESLLPIRASGRIPEIERLHHQMALTLARMPYYTLGDVSDKVKALVNLLTSYKEKQGFQAIVFVEQRHHAQALAMILGKSQVLQTFVRAMYFVGHGASGTERLASEGMEAKIVCPCLSVLLVNALNFRCSNVVPSKSSERARSTSLSLPA